MLEEPVVGKLTREDKRRADEKSSDKQKVDEQKVDEQNVHGVEPSGRASQEDVQHEHLMGSTQEAGDDDKTA